MVLLGVGMAAAFVLVYRTQVEINRRFGAERAGEDALYVRSPELLRRLSLGYESLLADIYWIRAVQYYGGRVKHLEGQTYQLLDPMLSLATSLDPQMTAVYRFGVMFLSEGRPVGAGDPQAGIRLMDKGIRSNPGLWRLHFDKGFVYLWHLRDAKAAGACFMEAFRQPGAPKWLESLAAYTLSEGGELETARYLWNRELEEAENDAVRENARNHLNSLRIEEDRWRLEFLASKYQEKTGRPVAHLNQLVAAGWLRALPRDPSGVPYEYEPALKAVYPSRGSKVTYFPLKGTEARQAYSKRMEEEWNAASKK